MVCLQIAEDGSFHLRTDMDRLHLFAECRRAGLNIWKGDILEPTDPSEELDGLDATRPDESHFSELQLRDMARLVAPASAGILARRGASLVCLGTLNTLISHGVAYVLVPATDPGSGARGGVLMPPLLARLDKGLGRAGLGEDKRRRPFEQVVLEALLHTLLEAWRGETEGMEAEARELEEQAGLGAMKTFWRLRRRAREVWEWSESAGQALEQTLADPPALALMYLSAQAEDPAAFRALLAAGKGNTQELGVLLDSLALQMQGLSARLLRLRQDMKGRLADLELQLSMARNGLWKASVVVGLAGLWISTAGLVANFGGVNLHIGGEEEHSGPYDGSGWSDCGDCQDGAGPSWTWLKWVVGSAVGAIAGFLFSMVGLWRAGCLR